MENLMILFFEWSQGEWAAMFVAFCILLLASLAVKDI